MAHSTQHGPPGLPIRKVALAAIAAEALLLVAYFAVTPADVTTPRYVVYPFVWINVALYAVYKVTVPTAPRRHRWAAAAIAGAYLLLLANWSGMTGLTAASHHSSVTTGLFIEPGSPGWERIRFVTETFYVSLVPFRAIGYLALAYLVYVALLDVTGAALSGALGLLSCLSCSFPLLASIATSVWGGSVFLMNTVYEYPIDIATATFLVSVGLLYWRPGFPSLPRRGNGEPATEE